MQAIPAVLLRRGADIVFPMLGCLLDHVDQRNIDLPKTWLSVLDEADRMLDTGSIHDIGRALNSSFF